MYSTLYKIYIYTLQIDKRNIFHRLFGTFFFYFCNVVMRNYYRFVGCANGLNRAKRDEEIIVSLTSYPKRTGTIWITLESLLRQSVKPDRIILWLAEDQYPNKVLPESLHDLQRRGITIRWCDNLMSHKKYFYVMQENPESNIITADDDSFYPPFFIERLIQMHKTHPSDIVCLTAQTMGANYRVVPTAWPGIEKQEIVSSFKISINSGSGALFPPHSISPKAFDKEIIKAMCPYADDLWLTVMAHINGTPITKYVYHPFPVVIKESLSDSLCKNFNSSTSNSGMDNDKQWSNIVTHFENELKNVVGIYY